MFPNFFVLVRMIIHTKYMVYGFDQALTERFFEGKRENLQHCRGQQYDKKDKVILGTDFVTFEPRKKNLSCEAFLILKFPANQ